MFAERACRILRYAALEMLASNRALPQSQQSDVDEPMAANEVIDCERLLRLKVEAIIIND
jgi:hypothetical protein